MKIYKSFKELESSNPTSKTCIEIFYLVGSDEYKFVRYYLECTILEAIENFIKEFPEHNNCEYRVRYYVSK